MLNPCYTIINQKYIKALIQSGECFYYVREVLTVKITNIRTKLKNLSKQPKPEILTDKDLKDLMGVHRDTYTRKGGAVRRK